MTERSRINNSLRQQSVLLRNLRYVLLCFLVLCSSTAMIQAQDSEVRLGFMKSVFTNLNENDILAAMKVWAQTIQEEQGILVNPNILYLQHISEAVKALQEDKMDALTLSIVDFPSIPEGLTSGPYFRHEIGGSTHTEFVLLAPANGSINLVKDLAGARIAVYLDRSHELGMHWLNAELIASGLGTISRSAVQIESKDKLSAAVLGVFFGQYDACLVQKTGFFNMAELNPQVGKKLNIVTVSPPVISSFFCFRNNTSTMIKEEILKAISKMKETVTGEQVLRVFKSDSMREITTEELERSLTMLRQWSAAATGEPEVSGGMSGGAQ